MHVIGQSQHLIVPRDTSRVINSTLSWRLLCTQRVFPSKLLKGISVIVSVTTIDHLVILKEEKPCLNSLFFNFDNIFLFSSTSNTSQIKNCRISLELIHHRWITSKFYEMKKQ